GLRREVEGADSVAGLVQGQCHRATHVAQANKCDLHVSSPLFSMIGWAQTSAASGCGPSVRTRRWSSTNSGVISSIVAGFQRGLRSLSISNARIPSAKSLCAQQPSDAQY